MINITDTFVLRPRYSDVDQMGYVYHANYVSFCHQARTELMRKMGIHDKSLEDRGVMMPVISFNIDYKSPGYYDDEIHITTTIKELPKVRFFFFYEIRNSEGKLLGKADSTVVFVKLDSRMPIVAPDYVIDALQGFSSSDQS